MHKNLTLSLWANGVSVQPHNNEAVHVGCSGVDEPEIVKALTKTFDLTPEGAKQLRKVFHNESQL